MAGLLGDGWDDPQTQFNLMLAAGLLGGRGRFGQVVGNALPGAMQARQQAQAAIGQRETQALQRRLIDSQISENDAQVASRKAATDRQRRMEDELSSVVSPQFDQGSYERWLAKWNPQEYIKMLGEKRKAGEPPKPPQNNYLELVTALHDPRTPEAQRPLIKAQIDKMNMPPMIPVQYVPGPGGVVQAAPGAIPRGGQLPQMPPNLQAPEKPLPQSAVNDLTSKKSDADNIKAVLGSFRDEYGGSMVDIAGRARNFASRNLPGFDEQRGNWWQQMDAIENQIRHGTFGASLTKTEKDSWDRTAVTPGMKAEAIRTNLQRRASIIDGALRRLAKTYGAGRYSPAQIEEATGIRAGQSGATESYESSGSPSIDERLKKYQ